MVSLYVVAFYALFLVATVFDALRDAWTFDNLFDDGRTDWIDEARWHPYKNISRLAGWIAFYVLGQALGAMPAVEIALAIMPGTWAIWQMVYNRSRFQQWFVHHDFNLTALTMMRGAGGVPLVCRLSRETMILICGVMIAGSVAAVTVIMRGF